MTEPSDQPGRAGSTSEAIWDVWCPQDESVLISGFHNKHDAKHAADEHNAMFTPPHKARVAVGHKEFDDPPPHHHHPHHQPAAQREG
ncbi:hypothetical protein ACFVVX_37415 [Kitasatospora sp. NPDC058170]|uniref:hypothetical protein n=1 Tax=Kitasatospora sp. NPDC058170 TaxID=3346364 RepID=UPI0036DCA4E4